jgi:NAD(P)-dependent dehydrogenase (short-subunit alcohol dehydrogenase family)
MGLLEDKTAVIAGGTTGIALATATRFIDEGGRVLITGQLGPRATGVRGDVGIGADLDRLYAAVDEAGRGLDIVMANAGIGGVAEIGSWRSAPNRGTRPAYR